MQRKYTLTEKNFRNGFSRVSCTSEMCWRDIEGVVFIYSKLVSVGNEIPELAVLT